MANPPVPVYRRIADRLRSAILSGELTDGDRLPGENVLMQEHGVARATARQALAVLINEGLAVPRRGSGVFVRTFRPVRRHGSRRLARGQWGAGRAIWDKDTEGRSYAVDAVQVVRESGPAEVAEILGTQDTWVRRRRYNVDHHPVQLATSFYPAVLVEGTAITREDTGPGGVYARLGDLGHPPVHFVEELRARMPLPEEVRQLSLSAGTPVILVTRTAFCDGGKAVEVNQMTMDASSYVLQYDFDA